MKKYLIIFTVLITSLLSKQGFCAYAESKQRNGGTSKKNLQAKFNEITNQDALGNTSVKLGSASNKYDVWGFTAGLEILVWQMMGEESDTATATISTTEIRGKFRNLDFDWQVGVRAMLGAITPYDDWTIAAVFTHFAPNEFNNPIQTAEAGLAGAQSTDLFTYGDANFSFDNDFNYLQFEMGRAYFVSGRFSLHPQFGFEVSWINLDNRYNFSSPTSGTSSLAYKDKIDYWGAGPRIGLSARMYLGMNFFFYGRAAAALEFGDFDISKNQTFTGTSTQSFSMKARDFHEVVNHNEIEVGAAFSLNFNQERARAIFKIGYEIQNWGSLNQFFYTNELDVVDWSKVDGSINFQGVSIGIVLEL